MLLIKLEIKLIRLNYIVLAHRLLSNMKKVKLFCMTFTVARRSPAENASLTIQKHLKEEPKNGSATLELSEYR